MGYCRECSCYVPDTAKFCNVCGSSNLEKISNAKVVEEKPVEVKPVVVTPTYQAPVVSYSFVERGPWKVFAKVGFILGLITFICGMLSTICLPLMLLADSVAFLAILALLGVFGFIVNLVNSIDMDNFQIFVEALHESDTFRKLIPYAIDKLFYEFGFNFVPNETDVLDKFYYFWDFGRLVKKYQPNDFFDLMVKMSNDDLVLLATLFENVIDSPATKGFIDFIFSNVFVDFSVYSLSDIYKIENWQNEVFYIRDFCAIMYDLRATGDVSISAVIDLLKNSDSQAVQIIVNVFQRNLDLFIEIFITGGPLL